MVQKADKMTSAIYLINAHTMSILTTHFVILNDAELNVHPNNISLPFVPRYGLT